MKGILFVTPCYGAQVWEAHFKSCLRLMSELAHMDLYCDWLTAHRESLVHRARMELTVSYLKTDFSHMMWLDADLQFTTEDVAKLWNLIEDDKADIAAGCYPMKNPEKSYYAAWKDGALVKDLNQYDGPIEVEYAGTGFMLMKRETVEGAYKFMRDRASAYDSIVNRVLSNEHKLGGLNEREMALLQESRDHFAPDYEGPDKQRVPALYMTPIHDDGLESEDYHFCRIAREAGYRLVMDPSVRLVHWGAFPYGADKTHAD